MHAVKLRKGILVKARNLGWDVVKCFEVFTQQNIWMFSSPFLATVLWTSRTESYQGQREENTSQCGPVTHPCFWTVVFWGGYAILWVFSPWWNWHRTKLLGASSVERLALVDLDPSQRHFQSSVTWQVLSCLWTKFLYAWMICMQV